MLEFEVSGVASTDLEFHHFFTNQNVTVPLLAVYLLTISLRYLTSHGITKFKIHEVWKYMVQKFSKNTFVVGDLLNVRDDLDDIRFPPVYVGVYKELDASQLINVENIFGFLIVEECNTLLSKPFEKSYYSTGNHKLNNFSNIYISSYTLNFEKANKIYLCC